eukprot:Plantae.Rhodophyta-Purpureofilum_apyrenoidigerum.ctg5115.p1 GENE.Plantae.Rhodophyta-Purpureofilum_apyrenoidigerum.ctg5115~~Plantae.Rhodophyta-Purpureofilum_apyrenoidigerum.ctg5115.p1  ORF type:complete len:527 (-),score=118.49 Plantae.Rhodophyta-Purpureofilum_apyrenoidigerum.ctg5115:281-1861(-)
MATGPTQSSAGRQRRPGGGPQIGPYIFGKTLGMGATGKVKLAKHVETGEYAAIKIVKKEYIQKKPSLKKKLQREITVMKLCNHPNVLRLLDVFEIDTHLFLVLEYVDGCELFEYLVNYGSLQPQKALFFFRQIIAGVEYCHKRLICHRDLKPENLLLDKNLNLKVADFGMTNLNPPGSLLDTSCGSPHYAAPEVVSGEMYDGLQADIWSCGVILYAMVTGRLPFDDDNIQRLLMKVQRGVFQFPTNMHPDIKALIQGMMMVQPNKRLTIAEIKQNPWFNSIQDEQPFEDNFELPREPIVHPDPAVLQGLVDLGWGDAASVRRELATSEANLEKVFYAQLEQHPMFHKAVAVKAEERDDEKVLKVEVASGEAIPLAQLEEAQQRMHYGTSPSNESLIQASIMHAQRDPNELPEMQIIEIPKPSESEPNMDLPTASSKHSLSDIPNSASTEMEMNEAKSVPETPQKATEGQKSEIKPSPSLIRQTELTGRKENVDIDMTALSINNSNGNSNDKNWFDTFRVFFIGGGN